MRSLPMVAALVFAFFPLTVVQFNLAHGGGVQKDCGCAQKQCDWREPVCGRHCEHCRKHCKKCWHEAPPIAPILGSAPALMAPVVFLPPQRAGAVPRRREDDLDKLKELIQLLDDLMPESNNALSSAVCDHSSAAAGAVSQSPAEETIDAKLARISHQLESIERVQAARIGALEEHVERLGEMTTEGFQEFHKRLQELDKE